MSTTQDTQLQEIEVSLDMAKSVVELGEALDRLHSNPDFKAVILNGYFREEAVRLVHLKGEYNLSKEQQEDVDKSIQAIGLLRSYFRKTFSQAQQALGAIEELENTREEVLSEE